MNEVCESCRYPVEECVCDDYDDFCEECDDFVEFCGCYDDYDYESDLDFDDDEPDYSDELDEDI